MNPYKCAAWPTSFFSPTLLPTFQEKKKKKPAQPSRKKKKKPAYFQNWQVGYEPRGTLQSTSNTKHNQFQEFYNKSHLNAYKMAF